MQYAGFLLRRERLARNWSQEGLCRGICTVSYLSKIEQGKAEASEEVLRLLLARMDMDWITVGEAEREMVEDAYEALAGCEYDRLREILAGMDGERLRCSALGPDWLLLSRHCDRGGPLEEGLEGCLDERQLAVQRMLQERFAEAARLYPCGAAYSALGSWHYCRGEHTQALETLQHAYDLAAREGRPAVMLFARLMMGNCYSNQRDLDAMERHYRVAERLARAMGEEETVESIRYNRAATWLEAGEYERALGYFETLAEPGRMALHKLAICYERLGRTGEALAALDRAETAPEQDLIPEPLEQAIRELVRYRVEHAEYLEDARYGEMLLAVFEGCRTELPSGYAVFHLPWVLEWYEHHRMYKQAYGLMKDFPETV